MGKKGNSDNTWLQNLKTKENQILLGFYQQLGDLGTICMQRYQNGRHPWPQIPLFGPRNGLKCHISVITAQKRSKTNENHILMGFYQQFEHLGTICMQRYQNGFYQQLGYVFSIYIIYKIVY